MDTAADGSTRTQTWVVWIFILIKTNLNCPCESLGI